MQNSELSLKSTTSPEVTVDTLKAALLSRNPRRQYNAWLSSRSPARGFGKDELYPLGFKLASDELITHLGEEVASSHLNDALLYPIFFGYRHYVELRLKNEIRRYSELLNKAAPDPIRYEHRLWKLWDMLRGALQEVHGEERVRQDYDHISKYVLVLHQLDEKSFSFRYADAEFPVLDQDTEFAVVNLERLREHLAELSDLMDKRGLF